MFRFAGALFRCSGIVVQPLNDLEYMYSSYLGISSVKVGLLKKENNLIGGSLRLLADSRPS